MESAADYSVESSADSLVVVVDSVVVVDPVMEAADSVVVVVDCLEDY